MDDLGISSESYYARTDSLNAPYGRAMTGALKRVQCRKSVAARLLEVDRVLKPHGLAVHVWDGFRPLACQKSLWDYFMQEAKDTLKDPSPTERYQHVSKYCSDPTRFDPEDSTTWPTHVTGGAVDLTLKRLATGELMFMGSIFDETSAVSHTDYFEMLALENPQRLSRAPGKPSGIGGSFTTR